MIVFKKPFKVHRLKSVCWVCLIIFLINPSVWAIDCRLEINQASYEELIELKGLGQKTVQLIADERAVGAFNDPQNFVDRVRGMGRKKLQKLFQQGLCVNGSQRFNTQQFNTRSMVKRKNANKNHSQKRHLKSEEYSEPEMIKLNRK
ncbi:MAG: helix-hairpin-helix domain-containing protein [Alcaligenaceae bacterium]|nr:helix-hairpin-helix domain-containing protein [Alcaligenaceae bacterium]